MDGGEVSALARCVSKQTRRACLDDSLLVEVSSDRRHAFANLVRLISLSIRAKCQLLGSIFNLRR